MPSRGNHTTSVERRAFLKKTSALGTAGLVGAAGCIGDSDDGTDNGTNDGSDNGNGGADFPSEAINMIVPYSEGGGSDTWMRQFAPVWSGILDVETQVENVEGAASLRGQGEVFRREQDGHHLSMTHIPSTPGAALLNSPGWDPRDMSMIGGFSFYTICFFVNPEYDVEGFDDVFEKYQSGEWSRVGGLGFGHTYHLIALLMRDDPEIEWEWDEWVNYEGSGPMISAVASDEVPFGLTSAQPLVSHHEEGDIRVVGSLYSEGSQPFAEAEIELETLTDAGYPNYDTFAAVDRGLVTGPDVPEENRQVLEDTLEESLDHEDIVEWSEESGNIRNFMPGDELQSEMDSAYETLQEEIDFDEIET